MKILKVFEKANTRRFIEKKQSFYPTHFSTTIEEKSLKVLNNWMQSLEFSREHLKIRLLFSSFKNIFKAIPFSWNSISWFEWKF